ncbi:MAG TPA: carotenoid 1,2-hydratase, partial [Bacteroidetes bacterium]|nr:carotenoid 1,2-hydratase [Bacteroidota bacterium]
MNKSHKVILLILMLFSTFNLLSQEWKNYPYSPNNSLISFPNDEGRHIEEPTEWWYVFSHLKGKSSGNDYTFMLTFFYRDTLIFDGLRIFNITNENTGEFFPDFKPVNYIKNEEDHLEIVANLQDHIETWKTKKDSTGKLIPFEYSLHASSKDAVLDIDMNVIKRPLILADSGYLFQGKNNYTYYYSFTGIEMNGFLTINNIKEKVSGIGWFDKQYGNFHPEVGEKYEWFSLQLSNGMDINTWNIFTLDNKLPFDPKYRLFNAYINDSTSLNTSQFNIEHISYFYSPDSSRIYGEKFRLTQDSLDLDLNIVVQNPNCEPIFPFPFYEGPIYINGSVGAESVTGKGFAELLHYYKFPIIEFIEPSGYWDYSIPITWTLKNPDDGRPLTYDLLIKNLGETQYTHIAQNLKDTVFMLDTALLDLNTAYSFMVTASSKDSFLVDTILTNGFFKPN